MASAFPVASLIQWPLLDSAPFAKATVENHAPALVRIIVLEIHVIRALGARHDEN